MPPSSDISNGESGAPPIGETPARRWRIAAVVAGLLIPAVLGFYYKLWWPGLILIKRDASLTILPIKQ